jgi:hypothetical protein
MAAELTSSRRTKDTQELFERLRARGIEPDTRQDGWPITFGTLAVADTEVGRSVGKLCQALKDHYIQSVAGIKFTSRLSGIGYTPHICNIGPPFVGTKVSHQHSVDSVRISSGINREAWISASLKLRRELLVVPLTEALQKVRPSWLSTQERQVLEQVFLSFRVPRPSKKASVTS